MPNMENNHSVTSSEIRSPLLSFFIIIVFAFAGLFIGNFIGLIAILPFYDFDLALTTNFIANPMADDSGRFPLLIVQGVSSICSFIISPLLYIHYYDRQNSSSYTRMATPLLPSILLTILLTQAFMFVNTPIIEWNMGIKFPDFLSHLETIAQQQEQYLKEITEYVTHFDSIFQLLLGLLVIAVIPGIGEELLFRGLIQGKLSAIFKNPHIAIWVAAFLFALFHFQFYGLVPRMLLGALFGYLYWWSGSLVLAMVAHFFNNGFTLVMVYLYQQDMINFDIDGTSEISSLTIVFFTLLFGSLVCYFFKFIKHQSQQDG